MLIGKPPIFDADPFKILEKAKLGKITPPRSKNPRIPMEVNNIVMKCLSNKIEDRYQSPVELLKHLAI